MTAFRVGGALRRCLGWSLIVFALWAVLWSRRLDWGMAPVVWVPALVLLLLGWSLKRSRRLELEERRLRLIDQGLLARRHELEIAADAELELVPTAGLWTVVLHQQGREWPLGSWLGRRRAESLAAWLETGLGQSLPRRAYRPHRLDV